jgi:hypothetical protein
VHVTIVFYQSTNCYELTPLKIWKIWRWLQDEGGTDSFSIKPPDEYLKNTSLKYNTNNLQYPSILTSPAGRGRLLKIRQTTATSQNSKTSSETIFMQSTHHSTRAGISQDSNFPLCGRPAAKQDNLTFLIPQRAVARCYLNRALRMYLASQDTSLEFAACWKVKRCWSRELGTLPNCLREFTKAKQLAFPGRELRYLKFLATRPVWWLNNWSNMENRRL